MTSTTITDPISGELATALRRLKLGKMLNTLADRLTLAKQQQLSHAAFTLVGAISDNARKLC